MSVATDLDGTLDWSMSQSPVPTVCISGRTWMEYDARAKAVAAHMPMFIRGSGAYADQGHAGRFKAGMIQMLGITTFYEDDPVQAEIIRQAVPSCLVVLRP